jgi:hypothetical protein
MTRSVRNRFDQVKAAVNPLDASVEIVEPQVYRREVGLETGKTAFQRADSCHQLVELALDILKPCIDPAQIPQDKVFRLFRHDPPPGRFYTRKPVPCRTRRAPRLSPWSPAATRLTPFLNAERFASQFGTSEARDHILDGLKKAGFR